MDMGVRGAEDWPLSWASSASREDALCRGRKKEAEKKMR